MGKSSLGGDSPAFPSTHWSMVSRAGESDTDARRSALSEILTRYLPALRAHLVRRKGLDRHRADDLLQSFVSDKVLDQQIFPRATAEKGKFRTFILTALDRFAVSQHRHDTAAKRNPGNLQPLPDGEAAPDDAHPQADVFDVAWAREVLTEALKRMREACQQSDRPDIWDIFDRRLLQPILEGAPPADYPTLARSVGLKSPAQASNLLTTAKRMFARCLRSAISQYAGHEQAVEQEINDLFQILAHGGALSIHRPRTD